MSLSAILISYLTLFGSLVDIFTEQKILRTRYIRRTN
jgi:hypothetical protein